MSTPDPCFQDLFVEKGWLKDAPPLHILASLTGGMAGILCNHPFDLVRNRLYNQPLGADVSPRLHHLQTPITCTSNPQPKNRAHTAL